MGLLPNTRLSLLMGLLPNALFDPPAPRLRRAGDFSGFSLISRIKKVRQYRRLLSNLFFKRRIENREKEQNTAFRSSPIRSHILTNWGYNIENKKLPHGRKFDCFYFLRVSFLNIFEFYTYTF